MQKVIIIRQFICICIAFMISNQSILNIPIQLNFRNLKLQRYQTTPATEWQSSQFWRDHAFFSKKREISKSCCTAKHLATFSFYIQLQVNKNEKSVSFMTRLFSRFSARVEDLQNSVLSAVYITYIAPLMISI